MSGPWRWEMIVAYREPGRHTETVVERCYPESLTRAEDIERRRRTDRWWIPAEHRDTAEILIDVRQVDLARRAS